ncbi:AIPR family protein [Glutamicibacter nicotianae]|uniref:AIPR family protein n=1 Tax=Glutamicibacter nicotianae TaxID=37929 RepID=UPI000EF8CFDF|nr:AIPR family protein [Glutamicibacter nicotianae]
MTLSPDQEMAIHAFQDYHEKNYPKLDEDSAFELYATHLVTHSQGVSEEAVRGSIVGESNDGGIDSFLILLNKTEVVGTDSVRLTTKKNSLEGLQKKVPLDIVVVQSKNSTKWDSEVFPKLRDVLQMMMDEKVSIQKLREYPLNEDVIGAAVTLRKLRRKLIPLSPLVTFRVHYVCFGKSKEINEYRKSKRRLLDNWLKEKLPQQTKVVVEYAGAERMNELASENADFDVPLQFVKAPVRDGGAMVGLVKLRDYAKFLRRPKSEAIRDEMFAVNVRDFAGKTARVNSAISATLAADDKSAFWWLNNGITIIADDAHDPTETDWVLTNPLIVNGLQTSNIIHLSSIAGTITRKRLNQSLLVRVVREPDPDIREAIIIGTNNQTTVNSLQLHANDPFQIRLEKYLLSKGWYYERRRYQYRGAAVAASKVRSLTEIAQAVIAVHLLAPDTARARPTAQLSTDAKFEQVFNERFPESLYDKSLRLMENVESYLRTPTALAFPDTATNTRFYLASGYVVRSMRLNKLDDFSAAIRINQVKPAASNKQLAEIHQILTDAAESLEDGKISRDQLFKGSTLKKEFFARIIRLNGGN